MEELKKKVVPGAVSAMIWGIASLAAMAAFGWIAAIVAFSKRKKALATYEQNPSDYSEKSLSVLRSAKTFSIIGLIASSVFTLIWIIYIIAAIVMFA
ncbi:MAG: hypothetical protein HY951_15920 [Bacteroidia bacterium]|nr:hypothetical protein [Bacteroidia bacterium]